MTKGAHVAAGVHRARGRALALTAIGLAVAAGAVAAALVATPSATGSPGGGGAPVGPATFLGRSGVEASWVLAQNRLPGTNSWRIPASVAIGGIEGFADRNYATAGERVGFYVATRARSYHVDAYRMGWYQGMGARLVWSSGTIQSQRQPPVPAHARASTWSAARTGTARSRWCSPTRSSRATTSSSSWPRVATRPTSRSPSGIRRAAPRTWS